MISNIFPFVLFIMVTFLTVYQGLTSGIFGGNGKSMAESTKCKETHTRNVIIDRTTYCNPNMEKIVDFIFETPSRIRIRPAIQNMKPEHIKKYKEATRRMKALSREDPRSFAQQANIHCAYCDNAYSQVGLPQMQLDVHNSWLFLPFHRWFLYFHEKILRSLIEDDDFVIPFWNYDDPVGMTLPSMFDESTSPLYDQLRNQELRGSTKLLDLRPHPNDPQHQLTDVEIIQNNLHVMRLQMITHSKTSKQFFGGKYIAGSPLIPNTPGSLERAPHNFIHNLIGSKSTPNGEDMGILYSAARDPIFYPHHMNVDRLWNVWKDLSSENKDPYDPEFLETSFLFYDEKAQLTRVKVKDCLNISTLGYRYDNVPITWLNTTNAPSFKTFIKRGRSQTLRKVTFPLDLKSTESITINRRIKNRSKIEKELAEEVVVIEDIKYNNGESVWFDVYINPSNAFIQTDTSNLATSFVTVPHGGSSDFKSRFFVGLTDILDDIGADGDDYIVVTLVPRKGNIKIGHLSIDFLDKHDF